MTKYLMMRILILIWLSFFSYAVMAQQSLIVTLDRAWGLLLGDEINVQVELSSTLGEVDLSSLPQTDKRYGTWLYLKDIELTEKQILLSYQIVNVPAENRRVSTPELYIKQGDEWVLIPSTPFMIGPSLAVSDTDGLANIDAKPDVSPTLIATDKIERQIVLFSAIAVLAGLVLLFWHFGWKPKNRDPFAQALHDLARLKWQRSVKPDEAARILHAAFNRTAGTIVVHGEIDRLLEQHPWLTPLKRDIEAFYKRSAEHFFTRESGQEPNISEVRKLAKACRSKEKMA